jgi:hypothetical protein
MWCDGSRVDINRPDRTSTSVVTDEVQSSSASSAKDGPSALRDLQNVRNVVCVAFGAFDRYYISWEDNSGEFHQGKRVRSSAFCMA